MDLRNLLKEEVGMCKLSAKINKLDKSNRTKALSTRRSVSVTTVTVMIQTHAELMCWGALCNELEIIPIKTTPCTTIKFSDSNNYHLNPAEDPGYLPANHAQSELTAKSLDPKLSGELFNSVNSPLTGKEGQVTAVVAKAHCIATENPARRTLNTL